MLKLILCEVLFVGGAGAEPVILDGPSRVRVSLHCAEL